MVRGTEAAETERHLKRIAFSLELIVLEMVFVRTW
jgi:hypothetical protein